MHLGAYDRMILMVFYLESKYGKDWADPVTSTLNYTEDEIAEGIDFIKSLVDGHVIMSLPTYYGSNGDNAAHQSNEWITGKIAGIFEWDSAATKYASALDDSNKDGFTVGEEIKFGDNNGGFSKVSMGLAITKTCEHVAEAATLIQFLLNEEKGASIMGSECGIPASKAGLGYAQAAGAVKDLVADANAKVMAFTTNKLDPLFESNDLKENGRMPRGAKQNEKPLSNTFVRRVHAVLQAALKQAVKERLIPYNPCENCRIPPKDKKEMTILPPERIGRYLQEAEKYGVLPMFYLELSSGLRRGELLALQWSDLNVKERILTVNKQVTRMEGELDVTEPKTKNSVRKVALSQQAVDLLVQEHEQHPDNPILFPSPRTGGYWSPDAVSRINRKLLKNAGIEEHVRFHDLRHTFATMAISSGVDVKTLSSMLGHYSAGFTLDTYTHITNDMQRGAAEKIGGFMESVTAANTPEPPDPPEQNRCKVIPFEKVG